MALMPSILISEYRYNQKLSEQIPERCMCIFLNNSEGMFMKIKLAALITILLTVFAMPAFADDVEKWIQDLKDPSLLVREAATEALVGLNDTRAVEPLIKALKDENSEVRENAVWSLRDLGDTRAVEPLIQVLKDENEDKWVRWSAALALGKLNDSRAVGPLI